MVTIIQAAQRCDVYNTYTYTYTHRHTKQSWNEKIEIEVNNRSMKCNLSHKAYYLVATQGEQGIKSCPVNKKRHIINININSNNT